MKIIFYIKNQKVQIVTVALLMFLFDSCVKDTASPNTPKQNQPTQKDITVDIVGTYEGYNVMSGNPDSVGTHAENMLIQKVSNDSVLIAGDKVLLISEIDGLSFNFQSQKTGSGKYYFATKTISFKYLLPQKVITTQGEVNCTLDYTYNGTKK